MFKSEFYQVVQVLTREHLSLMRGFSDVDSDSILFFFLFFGKADSKYAIFMAGFGSLGTHFLRQRYGALEPSETPFSELTVFFTSFVLFPVFCFNSNIIF